MIRFNAKTRTLVIRLPSWRDRRWLWVFGLLILLDITASYVDRPLAEALRQLGPELTGLFYLPAQSSNIRYYLVPLILVTPFLFAAQQALEDGSLRRVLTWLVQGIGFFVAALVVTALLGDLLQGVIGRTRPFLWFDQGEYGFAPISFGESGYNSFPSGRSATAFAAAMALSFLLPRLRWFWLGLATLLSLSLLILSSYYLTDLLAGAGLAILTTLWLRGFFARRGWVFVHRQGQYRVAAPGYLLSVKTRSWLNNRFGWRFGARGRLP